MTEPDENIIFLDRGSLRATLRVPNFRHAWQNYNQTGEADIVHRLASATIAVTNKVPLREPVLKQLPHLSLIAVAATGTDVIDLEACEKLGITVMNIRGYAVHSLPEHVFAMILALRRSLFSHADVVASGNWSTSEHFCVFSDPMHDLAGSTLGILGYGALGRSVAHIARAFHMKVLAHDPVPITDSGIVQASLDDILTKSDVISLHLPLTKATHHIIGASELAKMKRTALLINTARGGLVNEDALASAITAGTIAGAGIDVLSKEPPLMDNPLLELRSHRLLITPHIAWASEEAMQGLADHLIDNIESFVAQSR